MSLGENLQNLRKSRNYSQEDLAEKLEVSRQAVSKWESSSGMPETEKIVKICEIFDCSMDELIKGKISSEPGDEKIKYDNFISKFSQKIALGVMLILIGVSLMLALTSIKGINEDLSIIFLLIFIVFAVPIFIMAGMDMERFKTKYPKLPNFYKEEEIDAYSSKFSKILALAVGFILLGVTIFILLVSLNIFEEESTIPVSILMLFLSVSVPAIVYAGINKDKYDIDKYNKENSYNFGQTGDKVGKYSAIIMLVTTIIYLCISFIFKIWYISWIVYPVGGMICGIVSILLKKD